MENRLPRKTTFKPNPIIDEFLLIPLIEIPTKQEKYKRLIWNFYLKRSIDKNKEFETFIRAKLLKEKQHNWPLKDLLEVYISITGKKSRINIVDIDNLLKSVLDCLNGIVYNDDKQIIQVIGRKFSSDEIPGNNSLIIAIRKTKGPNDLKFSNLSLGSFINSEY